MANNNDKGPAGNVRDWGGGERSTKSNKIRPDLPPKPVDIDSRPFGGTSLRSSISGLPRWPNPFGAVGKTTRGLPIRRGTDDDDDVNVSDEFVGTIRTYKDPETNEEREVTTLAEAMEIFASQTPAGDEFLNQFIMESLNLTEYSDDPLVKSAKTTAERLTRTRATDKYFELIEKLAKEGSDALTKDELEYVVTTYPTNKQQWQAEVDKGRTGTTTPTKYNLLSTGGIFNSNNQLEISNGAMQAINWEKDLASKGILTYENIAGQRIITGRSGPVFTDEERQIVGILNSGIREKLFTAQNDLIKINVGNKAKMRLEQYKADLIHRQNSIDNSHKLNIESMRHARETNQLEELIRSNRENERLKMENLRLDRTREHLSFFMAIAANPGILFFMSQFGFAANLAEELGIDMADFNVPSPSLNPLGAFNAQQFQQMTAEQRQMSLYAMQAQTGLSIPDIMGKIQGDAPGGVSQGISRGTFA